MAVNKTAGMTKVKPGPAPKKAAAVKKAAPKKVAALKAAPPTSAKPAPVPAPKKAAPKKAAGPKLTAPQFELLKKVVAHTDAPGYHTDKKPEHRVLESLLKHKVVKKGPKNPETQYFHYQVSSIGKKYLESAATPKS